MSLPAGQEAPLADEIDSHEIALADLPPAPARIAKLAVANGWVVQALYGRGYVPDPTGAPTFATVKEARTNEDGSPVLTPTGKQSYREVATDQVLVADTHVVRARTTWEREVVVATAVWHDGVFVASWSLRSGGTRRPLQGARITEMKRLLTSGGRPADVPPTTEKETT